MTVGSPDCFQQIRISNSSIKASNFNLQSMEFKSHSATANEYRLEILEHLLNFELKTLPNLSLIQQQPEINLKMRPLLLDFLMDVINKLNLSKSTFPLTVNLIDRYCSTRIVKKQHYQLLGLTSLWISCKNLDSKFKIPSLYDLCKMCCNCYDKKLFLEMENHLLKSLNWLVGSPTFDSFIDLFLNLLILNDNLAGSNNLKKYLNDLKILSIYICELIQFYPNIYFNYNSSQISLCGLITSLLILDIPINISHCLNYFNSKVSDFEVLSLNSFNSLFQNLLKILKCPPPSLKLKYFNDNGKFIHLMKLLINFTNKTVEPVTPKVNTVNLPPTPVSNNISPKDMKNDIICGKTKSPTSLLSSTIHSSVSPAYASSSSNIHPPLVIPRKRSISEDNSENSLKRSKSIRPVFFIS